jgi:hypothetical protein
MSGAIPPLPQYAFMAWCSVKAQGQLYLYFYSTASVFSFFLTLSGINIYTREDHLLCVPPKFTFLFSVLSVCDPVSIAQLNCYTLRLEAELE